jgi:hypothetical protein
VDDSRSDARAADREAQARARLLRSAPDLPRAPWLADRQPPHSVDLVRHLVWRTSAGNARVPTEDLLAALTLLPAARAELDQLEAAVLFTARSEGLPWALVADALRLGSRQAAQQRFDRVLGRLDAPEDGQP